MVVETNKIIESGSDLEAIVDETDGSTLLHILAIRSAECIKLFLKAGANIEAKSKYGETPLHRAARYSHLEEVRTLLAEGANVNARDSDGLAPLHAATFESGDVPTVELLLEAGADFWSKDDKGYTALDHAGVHNNACYGILVAHRDKLALA